MLGWNPAAGSNTTVYSLALSGTTLYVGGSFGNFGSSVRRNIAALDTGSAAATSWDPSAYATTGGGQVWSLAVSGGTVYVGGLFNTLGGAGRRFVGAVDATSGAATAWNPGADGTIYSLSVAGSSVYVAGNADLIGGTPRTNLAKIDAAGNLTSWAPTTDGGSTLTSLAVSGHTAYVGGIIDSLSGPNGSFARQNLGAVDTETGNVTDFDPQSNNTVQTLAAAGGTLYAGGDFTAMGSTTRNYAASFDTASGTLNGWNPNPNATVLAIAPAGGTVYLGGVFSTVGSTTRKELASVAASDASLGSWNPGVFGGPVRTIAVAGNTVYVGGTFTKLGGGTGATARKSLGAIAADATGTLGSWNPGTDTGSTVWSLLVSGNTVYAAGDFAKIGGGTGTTTRNGLAGLDPVTAAVTTWDPGLAAGISMSTFAGGPGDTLFAGGPVGVLFP